VTLEDLVGVGRRLKVFLRLKHGLASKCNNSIHSEVMTYQNKLWLTSTAILERLIHSGVINQTHITQDLAN
jgi:hypothetical protein